jgi:NAD+ synthase
LVESFTTLLPDTSGLAHENLQARLRGLILMSQANQNGWMVLSTGNKSELSVGYATLYGDMCGGYNVLKDTYKTQVYALARWRNDKQNPLINERILTKAPTAELKPNQTDQDTLPPYDILDPILMDLVEGDMSPQALIDGGQNPDTVRKIVRMLTAAEHKRRQAAPGPKVSSRAFGRERRYPITNGFFR